MIREMSQARNYIDANLPAWARRSNPIVKRQLGYFWRVIPPQLEPLAQWYVIQSGLVLLTIVLPLLYTLLLPLVLISLSILPFALAYYGRALYDLAADSSRAMVSEVEDNTLTLLMATPMSVREILLSKIAASLWRQSDPLSILLTIVAYTQMPALTLLYVNAFPVEQYGVLPQFMVVLVFAASIARLPLEMFMVATMGQYIGATTPGRGTAAATTLGAVVFYFALLNAPRLFPLPPGLVILVEGVLPVLLPALVIAALLALTERELGR
jgi:hypothetical protein